MATSKRGIDFAKLDKALRKHYSPVWLPDRPLLENLLFACCLEDSDFQAAEDAYARVQEIYFDWNEIRVTSPSELAEAMKTLADPKAAALRLRTCLQAVFEQGVMNVTYEYDLEFLKKENLGKAQAELAKIKGVSPFVAAFVVQRSLGGHAIPLDSSAMRLFAGLGAVKPGDEETCQVPGLERAVPKNKGAEFATLLHQAAVEFATDSHGVKIRKLLKEVDPDSPKRVDAQETTAREEKAEKVAAQAAARIARRKAAAKAAEARIAEPKTPAKGPGAKGPAGKTAARKAAPPAAAKKKAPPKKKTAAKPTTAAKSTAPAKARPKKPR